MRRLGGPPRCGAPATHSRHPLAKVAYGSRGEQWRTGDEERSWTHLERVGQRQPGHTASNNDDAETVGLGHDAILSALRPSTKGVLVGNVSERPAEVVLCVESNARCERLQERKRNNVNLYGVLVNVSLRLSRMRGVGFVRHQSRNDRRRESLILHNQQPTASSRPPGQATKYSDLMDWTTGSPTLKARPAALAHRRV